MAKKFRSPKGDIRVALLDGNVAIIGKDFRELPEVFHSEAYALGAVSDDMKVPSIDDYVAEQKAIQEQKEEAELNELRNVLVGIYDNPTGYVDGKGKLIQRKIVQELGRPIKKELIDKLWDEVVENITEDK